MSHVCSDFQDEARMCEWVGCVCVGGGGYWRVCLELSLLRRARRIEAKQIPALDFVSCLLLETLHLNTP